MTHSSSLSAQRARLAKEQNNRCHWCKVEMTPTLPPRTRKDPPFPDTMCTVDHVYDRLDPRRRQKPKANEKRLVAACLKCNQRRSVESQKKYGKTRFVERSKRFDVSGTL